jgi:hypothetical protein
MSDERTIEDRNAELASVRQATLDLSHDELFRQAAEPEGAAEQPPQEQEVPRHDFRGENGRFAPRPEQETQVAPEQPQEEGDVPSWRHRELREQRDAAANRAAQLEYMLMDQQRQLNAFRQRFEQPPQAPPPDVIADPDAYTRHLQDGFQNALRNQEANISFRFAHNAYGDVFEQAYSEMIGRAERGDPTVVRAVMANPDPGAAMVNWFQREQTLRTVGPDPNQWFNSTLGERLRDPTFQASVLDYVRGLAQPGVPSQSGMRTAVNLPPSLNRMAASASNDAGTGDLSDASLFHHAFREGRR